MLTLQKLLDKKKTEMIQEKPEELIRLINKVIDFDIRKKSRKRIIVYSRYIFFLKIHALNDPKDRSIYTLERIANYVNMDHAIVLHAIKEYPKLCNYYDFIDLEKEINEAIAEENNFNSKKIESLNNCYFEIKRTKRTEKTLQNEPI
jgi:hypothetical protein